MDESFVAKLLDVGTVLEFSEGQVVSSPDEPRSGLLLVLQGVLEVDGGERGPGHAVGRLESLEAVTVVAATDVRLVAVDRAAYEAAESG